MGFSARSNACGKVICWLHVGLQGGAVNLVQRGCHHIEGQEQAQPDNHGRRRDVRRAERALEERQHNDDAREGGHHQQDGRRNRQQGKYREDLQRGGDLLRVARRADLYAHARDGNRLLRNRWEEEGEQEEQGENSA
jgi:hypothetical protein